MTQEVSVETDPVDAVDETCFLIGPIGDTDAEDGSDARRIYEQGLQVLEKIVEPACRSFRIGVVRADRMAQQGEITEQIFLQLRDAPIVVADLTGGNANVMYELGLRHTTGKLTIQIGERDRLPFDITTIRTIFFRRTELGFVEARDQLKEALRNGLGDGMMPVTATRVWLQGSAVAAASRARRAKHGADSEHSGTDEDQERESDSPTADDDAPGFLDLLADAEESLPILQGSIEEANEVLQEITGIIGEAAERARAADQRGAGAAAKLAITERLAADLEERVARFRQAALSYREQLNRLDPAMELFGELMASGEMETAAAEDFISAVAEFAQVAEEGAEGALELKGALEEAGKTSRRLRSTNKGFARALDGYAAGAEVIGGWKSLLEGPASG